MTPQKKTTPKQKPVTGVPSFEVQKFDQGKEVPAYFEKIDPVAALPAIETPDTLSIAESKRSPRVYIEQETIHDKIGFSESAIFTGLHVKRQPVIAFSEDGQKIKIWDFENKYYAFYPGISDIQSVIDLLRKDVKDIKSGQEIGESVVYADTVEDILYISYNWESGSQHTVDYLCYVLDTHGIPYKRDKKDCPYNDNIKDFMDTIRKGKMVIVVLSRPYLYSQNCMYELTGILENEQYKERILPVVMDDTIRSSLFYVDLVGYWKGKKDEQEEMVRELNLINPNKAKPEAAKLKVIETIYDKLDAIKEYIDWTNAENLDSLCATQFRSIIEIILKRV